jgi:hypothetical protein
MDATDFIEKVKKLGYKVEHRFNDNNLMDDEFVVSKDNCYFALKSSLVIDAPFEYLMEIIEDEISKLNLSH